MSEHQLPKLGNSHSDLVAALARATTGMVPVIGSLIAEIVTSVIPNQRIDRIVRLVELLEQRLGALESEKLKETFSQEPVVDLLEDAFIQASRATSQERLIHIANVIANGLSADEFKQAEAKRMLWLLGQLNDAEVIILRSKLALTRGDVQQDSEFREKHAELLNPSLVTMGSTPDQVAEAALKSSYHQHLLDLMLVQHRFSKPRPGALPEFDEKTGMMKANGSDVTRLGRMLLKYLNLIPDWYRY